MPASPKNSMIQTSKKLRTETFIYRAAFKVARKFGANCSKCQRSTEQQQSIKCFKIHSKDLLQNNDFHITSSIFLLSSVLVFYFFLILFLIPSFIVSLLPEFLAFCPNIFETGGAAAPLAPPARTGFFYVEKVTKSSHHLSHDRASKGMGLFLV